MISEITNCETNSWFIVGFSAFTKLLVTKTVSFFNQFSAKNIKIVWSTSCIIWWDDLIRSLIIWLIHGLLLNVQSQENKIKYINVCWQCGRNALVLQQTYTLVERSVQQDSENTEYINELGFQLLLQGKVKDAMKCYRNAMKINDTSVQSLTGRLLSFCL